jgi:hypothetical protein
MASQTHGADLLLQAYEDLDLVRGTLLPASSAPRQASRKEWRAVGEWLMLADRMGAERVFFVGGDPVILFARMPPGSTEVDILAAYRRAWSLTRPRCLFLAAEDELRVYALSTPPARSLDEAVTLQPIETVTRAADVAERLALYHRESLEAGALFDTDTYAKRQGRADTRLLHDVRVATAELVAAGLDRPIAHTLIERMILIRYLEDREIVTPTYFDDIAAVEDRWVDALTDGSGMPMLGAQSSFLSCLRSKQFTYAVFRKLAQDFNGDLFVVSDNELNAVTQRHLELVQRLLTGAGLDSQDPLFLWAYDFGVVPTSLISSMYEEFYRAGTDDDGGTHYTPPELVEFVLTEALTPEVLNRAPKICDPACGSGIFLVEAFRRIVRHEAASTGRRLSPQRLRQLLLERIAGSDLNGEAIRLAAFSLYLAYLNYQTPRDIRAAGPLPRLIYRPKETSETGILVEADAFAQTQGEAAENPGRLGTAILPWTKFDVVVGNPPWDEPRQSSSRSADKWAAERTLAVGDRNPSQLFLWRALSLLKKDGTAALLVGAAALHNSRHTSRLFRRRWLQSICLDGVVNFTAVRDLFFDGGIAPFMLVKFHHLASSPTEETSNSFRYQTVRPSSALASTRSLDHARIDRRWVDQQSLMNRDYLWKTYAWGDHHDEAFMSRLDAERRLSEFLPKGTVPGYGYQRGSDLPTTRLASLRSLKRFDPWGPLRADWFEDPPTGVKRQPDEKLYEGRRIVIARGVRSGFGPSARLESEQFSFRHTIYCLPLRSAPAWQAQTVIGVLLSALGRYRLFMASGSWGVWHDSFVPDDILNLPMRMADRSSEVTRRISRAVEELRRTERVTESTHSLFHDISTGDREPSPADALNDLDEAVFDLFELTGAERDLVKDFCRYTLPLVGRRTAWARQPVVNLGSSHAGTVADLVNSREIPLAPYLQAFLGIWNRELAPAGEFDWRAIGSPRSSMLAVVFQTRDVRASKPPESGDAPLWHDVLERLADSLGTPLTASIRRNGTLRGVTDDSVVIAKRSEERLWTASAAREDAEATILQAMALRASR